MAKMGGKIKEAIRKRKWRVHVKTWMLLVLIFLLLPIDATLLRNDHIKMTELRAEVLAIDEKISNDESEEVESELDAELGEALARLKEFVFSHIVVNVVEENGVQRLSFGTGPFYLEHQYLRAATKALAEAEKAQTSDANPNGNIYALAGEHCRSEAYANGWNWNSPGYINCMMSELAKYPASENLTDTIIAKLPSTELYRKNYASPIWAPTLSGWTILLTLILAVMVLVRFFYWLVLRIALFFI